MDEKLKVTAIEATAAAFAYDLDENLQSGGTFDVSVLKDHYSKFVQPPVTYISVEKISTIA